MCTIIRSGLLPPGGDVEFGGQYNRYEMIDAITPRKLAPINTSFRINQDFLIWKLGLIRLGILIIQFTFPLDK